MTFQMWSPLHFIFIASPFIFVFITFFCFRKASFKAKRIAGIVFSAIACAFLLARNIEIFINNGFKIEPEIIPLQICHFANFVLLFAFIFNSKALFAFSFCFNLPAAFLSIIFADSLVNYTTILTARGLAYLFGHMLIVGIALYAFIFNFVKINKKTLLITLGIVLGLFILSLFINNLFNVLMPNHVSFYFYSTIPEPGTPLEIFYTLGKNIYIGKFVFNPIYMLLTALLGVVVILIFYGIYLLKELIYKKAKFKFIEVK